MFQVREDRVKDGKRVNVVNLIGYVGNDPELRTTLSGQPVVNLSLATTEFYNDKQGEQQSRTEWHRLVIWGNKAEVVNKYVNKGDKLGVEGKLQSRKWVDRQNAQRMTVEINVMRVHLLNDDWQEERMPTGEEEEYDEQVETRVR